MCYVVAKNANKIGSVAIRMKLGKAVVQLKEEMNDQYLSKHIQFVTISRPSAYGEYAPDHFVDTIPAEIRAVSGAREVADSAPQGRKGKGKRRRKGVKTMSCRAQRAMRRVR